MKVLLVVYAPQKSFSDFTKQISTKFPWVDTLLESILECAEIDCGLVVPINEGSYKFAKNKQITLYGLPNDLAKISARKSLRRLAGNVHESQLLKYLQIAISDFNPDIIEVFGTENEFGMICNQVSRPVVIHFQGSIKAVSTKWFTGITRWEQLKSLTIRKILNGSGVFKEYASFNLRGSREDIIMRSCNYFIGRTEFDRRLISLISPQAKYFFCEEFIRKDFFKIQWNTPLSGAIKCISILKGVTYKGIDLIFDTIKVLKQYGVPNVTFTICGVSDNEEIVQILKNRYKNSGCIESVKFIGKVDTRVLIHELTTSNFFIHPSYMENSSNSICEAMALGMPVIATNVGGTSSLIEDGRDGLLVQEGEPFSMAASIVGLIKEYHRAIDLGKNAREKAIMRHSPELLKKRTLEIYKDIIEYARKEN